MKGKVLISPLNWGLGHASRTIAVIRNLLDRDIKPIIAGAEKPLALLCREFPELPYLELSDLDIRYPKSGNMAWSMFRQSPSIIRNIMLEHQRTGSIAEKYGIKAIISDNRYGLYSSKAYNVLITHQLRIQTPWPFKFPEGLLFMINNRLRKAFQEVWIPDFPTGPRLSGQLSNTQGLSERHIFIGPLSRFLHINSSNTDYNTELLVCLSGPEPQCSLLKQLILNQLKCTPMKCIFFLGQPEKNSIMNIDDDITFISHLETEAFQKILTQAPIVISRSGYSSVMDMVRCRKKAIFIPTPGQTEQEYLADYLKQKNWFYSSPQESFKLKTAIMESLNYKPPIIPEDNKLLSNAIDNLIEKARLK